MRDTCLIYLPHPYLKQPNAQAPIGLLYLASQLEREKIPVVIKNYSSFSFDQILEDLPPAILFGITATSLEVPIANKVAKIIKLKYPNSRVILGGPGSLTPNKINMEYVDSIFMGEAETKIGLVHRHACFGTLPSVYSGEPVSDLDTLAFPARHLLDYQGGNIFAYNTQYKGEGSTVILSSRGCPFKCSFCSSPFVGKRKVRYRSPENVVDEIKSVIKNQEIYQFRFSDDMFTANRRRVMDLCSFLKPLDIIWRISCRSVPCDLELFQTMYDAGLREMSIGVESFDNNVLSLLDKGLSTEDNIKCLNTCREVGIKTRILLMIRTPGQTQETVNRNIEILEKVPYDIVACTTFVPLPGSDIWRSPEKYGIEILNRDLEDYNFYFYTPEGETPLKDVIKLKGRNMDEVNEETLRFKDYLKSTGKLNEG